MSGDPEQGYFADGIVEDITTALSRFKELFVIARNSSFAFKGKSVDIQQVAREPGVRYVLEGSVRKASGRVRITGQLIDAGTRAHLWAEKFDASFEDVFELQDKITEGVVGALCAEPAESGAGKGRGASHPSVLTPTIVSSERCPHVIANTPAAPAEAIRFLDLGLVNRPGLRVRPRVVRERYGTDFSRHGRERRVEDGDKGRRAPCPRAHWRWR